MKQKCKMIAAAATAAAWSLGTKCATTFARECICHNNNNIVITIAKLFSFGVFFCFCFSLIFITKKISLCILVPYACTVYTYCERKKRKSVHITSSLAIEWIIEILLLPLKIIIYNQNSIKHSRKNHCSSEAKMTPVRWGQSEFKCSKLIFAPL